MTSYKERLQNFGIDSIPDLDEVVLGALELFAAEKPPSVNLQQFTRPLVVGSGNAAITGKVLFDGTQAVFADESSFEHVFSTSDVDGVVVISASGGKHAIEIAQTAKERNVPLVLLTNNPGAPAKTFVEDSHFYVFPKNREPYTYNTSTYLGMMLGHTNENPDEILSFIASEVTTKIPANFANYNAFFLIVPAAFNEVRGMFKTKFDELFSSQVVGRVFTYEQTKHAKTVVENDKELFVSFGVENDVFGKAENRLFIPLPENAGPAAMVAVAYYVIGHIQKQFPPYFKGSIVRYTEEASALFGQTINPIVE